MPYHDGKNEKRVNQKKTERLNKFKLSHHHSATQMQQAEGKLKGGSLTDQHRKTSYIELARIMPLMFSFNYCVRFMNVGCYYLCLFILLPVGRSANGAQWLVKPLFPNKMQNSFVMTEDIFIRTLNKISD